jgi:hypothetical protein
MGGAARWDAGAEAAVTRGRRGGRGVHPCESLHWLAVARRLHRRHRATFGTSVAIYSSMLRGTALVPDCRDAKSFFIDDQQSHDCPRTRQPASNFNPSSSSSRGVAALARHPSQLRWMGLDRPSDSSNEPPDRSAGT